MFEQNDDKTIMSFIVHNCPVFYFAKEEQNFPLDVEQFLRKCQLKHVVTPHEVYCSSIQNLFLEKRYLIQGKTRSPLTDKEFYIQPSRKVNMLNHITKSILYTRLTVNSKFIRVSYMMFFKENEGAIEKEELLGQQHGDWKHVSLYFDKTTQDLVYVVLNNHFTENQIVSADQLQFETVSGQYRPVFYVAQGTHSIYPSEGEHEIDTIRETTESGKKWMPRNIVFLPETLQRARRTKSSWVYYHGQYGSDKAYGPVYQPWWNQDSEFIEYINDVGMGDFKIRSDRIEEISSVIEETTERIRSRTRPTRPQTEVNRSRLHKTATAIKRLSTFQPTSLTQKAEVLLEKQKYIEVEEKSIQDAKKELESKLREFQEQQEHLQRHQHKLLQNQEAVEEQQKQLETERALLKEKEEAFIARETEINQLKRKLTSDIEEVVNRKHKIECEEKDLEELRTKIHQIETREKELDTHQGQMKKERDSIRNMITQGMQKSQEDYSSKKKELMEQERQIHVSQHQLSEKSKELRELEEQLQEMTEQLEQRQSQIQEQEEYIQSKQSLFESEKEAFENEKKAFEKKEETNQATQTQESQDTLETEKSMTNLQTEIHNLRERTVRLTQREIALETQIAELQQDIDKIQKEAKMSLSSLKQTYDNELTKVKDSLQSREKRIHQLEVLLQSAKEQHTEHKKEKSVQQDRMELLRSSLEDSLQKEKELKESIQSLEIQLTAQTQLVDHMREELESTEKKLIDSVHRETTEPTEPTELTEDTSIGAKVARVLRQRDQEIQQLRHYIETVEYKVQNVEKAKNDSQTELERIQKEFNELETKYQEEVEGKLKTQVEYTTLLDSVQQQVLELTNQVNEYKEKEQEWKLKYEQSRHQYTKSQQDHRKLHQQFTVLSKDHGEVRKRIHSKTQELEALQQTKEALEKTLQEVQKTASQREQEYVDTHKQELVSMEKEYTDKIREAQDVIQLHQATINDQSNKLEHQRQHMEKQKQELNTRMTRMIDKADLVQSQVRVTELQQALEISQRENSVIREHKEKFEKTVSEQQQRLRYMETQVDEWKKQMDSMEQVARTTEQKYTRIVQEVERYKAREKDMISREQSMEAQQREWENQLATLRDTHEEEKKDLQKQLDQLVHLKQTEQRKHVSAKSAPTSAPAPAPHVGNLMFTQTRAPVIGRRRQKTWIRR